MTICGRWIFDDEDGQKLGGAVSLALWLTW